MVQFGEVQWGSAGKDGRTNAKDLFLKLDEGQNKLRLITLPHQYSVHKVKVSSDPKQYAQKVYCSKVNGECLVCDMSQALLESKLADGSDNEHDKKRGKDIKSKNRWLVGVLSRKDGKTKVLDISYTVFNDIRNLVNSEDWGDPTTYDINIVVDRDGGATGYYSVQPCPKKPLTAEEQVLKDNFDISELQTRVTPPQPDAVVTRYNKLVELAGDNVVSFAPSSVEDASDTKSHSDDAESSDVNSEDEDDDFPQFQAASV